VPQRAGRLAGKRGDRRGRRERRRAARHSLRRPGAGGRRPACVDRARDSSRGASNRCSVPLHRLCPFRGRDVSFSQAGRSCVGSRDNPTAQVLDPTSVPMVAAGGACRLRTVSTDRDGQLQPIGRDANRCIRARGCAAVTVTTTDSYTVRHSLLLGVKRRLSRSHYSTMSIGETHPRGTRASRFEQLQPVRPQVKCCWSPAALTPASSMRARPRWARRGKGATTHFIRNLSAFSPNVAVATCDRSSLRPTVSRSQSCTTTPASSWASGSRPTLSCSKRTVARALRRRLPRSGVATESR
jgi:hypothetical protein